MVKIELNKSDLDLADKVAAHYRHPEGTSYYDKEILSEAKANNPNIHYKALEINRNIWHKGLNYYEQ